MTVEDEELADLLLWNGEKWLEQLPAFLYPVIRAPGGRRKETYCSSNLNITSKGSP